MPISKSLSLRSAVDNALPVLRALSDADGDAPRPGWTRKQELGHLVDSASNNHQRFVRAALEDGYAGPSYNGDAWVGLADYAHLPWPFLVELWAAYNMLLAHVIAKIPEGALAAECSVGGRDPAKLSFLVDDYVRHLRHHVGHILA